MSVFYDYGTLARVAITGLMLSCGVPEDELDSVIAHLRDQEVAREPSAIVQQVRDAYEAVRK